MQNKKEKKGRVIPKNLDESLALIAKKFGKNSLMRIGDNWQMADLEVIPSGSIALNAAMGVGGYPKGRIIEILGPEMSGKSTLSLQAIAEAQEKGGIAAYIDAEHAFDATYAGGIGVNVDDLFINQPDSGEEALNIVEELVRSNEMDIIAVDSVAALVPQAEVDGAIGDSHMGLQARMMGQACRKLSGIVSKTKTCLIFINQIRYKIGLIFGNPETTPGGNALKFYSTIRLDIRKISAIKDGEKNVGNRVKVKVVKNKVAPPFNVCEFNILFGTGIDQIADLVETGIDCGVIAKSGTWLSYGKDRLGQGLDACRETLADCDLFNKIKKEVIEKWK